MIDLPGARWRKSSRSQQGPHCVEVAGNVPGIVAVRDSKNPDLGFHVVPASEWASFVEGVKSGRFD